MLNDLKHKTIDSITALLKTGDILESLEKEILRPEVQSSDFKTLNLFQMF